MLQSNCESPRIACLFGGQLIVWPDVVCVRMWSLLSSKWCEERKRTGCTGPVSRNVKHSIRLSMKSTTFTEDTMRSGTSRSSILTCTIYVRQFRQFCCCCFSVFRSQSPWTVWIFPSHSLSLSAYLSLRFSSFFFSLVQFLGLAVFCFFVDRLNTRILIKHWTRKIHSHEKRLAVDLFFFFSYSSLLTYTLSVGACIK